MIRGDPPEARTSRSLSAKASGAATLAVLSTGEPVVAAGKGGGLHAATLGDGKTGAAGDRVRGLVPYPDDDTCGRGANCVEIGHPVRARDHVQTHERVVSGTIVFGR